MPIAAIVLADDRTARARVVGLSLAERARRVAVRAGATDVLVVHDRAAIAPWWRTHARDRVLVIRATDQLVHPPLVAGLAERLRDRDTVIAVAPAARADTDARDLAPGAYAGALLARGREADALVDALAAGADDRALAATALAASGAAVPHGPIARHPARTRAERRAAARMLYRIIHKPQDNAITRYLYRPISFPLTRLLVHTGITPNQISLVTAVLVVIGCWLTARGPMDSAFHGTLFLLAASYVDCCDGEVARLKLESSRLGAWLDTVVDELSQVAYLVALGLHCRAFFGADYLGGPASDLWRFAIIVGAATYLLAIYCIYWNIIVVVGSANSQDYIGRFEIAPGDAPGTARLRPVATQAIPTHDLPYPLRLLATYAPYLVRKDLVCWATVGFAFFGLTHVAFLLLTLGGLTTALIVANDHVRLRHQLSTIRRRALVLVR